MNDDKFELNQLFSKKVNARQYSPLALAFIGDSIYDLIIRTEVVSQANAPVNKYHVECQKYVKASEQAKVAHYFVHENIITDEEKAVFKRGRNAKSATSAKNSSLIDYKNATGLEALFGFLYLDGRMERVLELMNLAVSYLQKGDHHE